MKTKEKTALHTMTIDELKKMLAEKSKSLAVFTKERYTKQSKNVREGKNIRQEIARIKTQIRQKELLA